MKNFDKKIYKIEKMNDKFLSEVYQNTFDELSDFFEIKIEKNFPRIILVKNRETINSLKDKKTEKRVVGWSEWINLFILDKENFETESNHKYTKTEYAKLIKHEMAHFFFKILSKNGYLPLWFMEGTALYLAKQISPKKNIKEFSKFLNKDNVAGIYQESGYAIGLLIEKFGKDFFIDFIKNTTNIKNEKDFLKSFGEKYAFKVNYTSFNLLTKD